MSSVRLTSGVSSAPENNWAVLVFLSTKDVVELDGKAVKVSDVQRAKVVVECIVEESIVNGEVARGLCVARG